MKYLNFVFILFFIGCGSTPNENHYAQHVNLLDDNYISPENFKFSFNENIYVNINGKYDLSDSVAGSNIMYQGGGGLIGMLAQVGTHAAIINASRDNKLSDKQLAANAKISSLIDSSKDIRLTDLINNQASSFLENEESKNHNKVNISPVFFSNEKMDTFSVKMTVWINSTKKSKHKNYKYRNMIQVYAAPILITEHEKIISGDKSAISLVLSELLNTAIHITQNDLSGIYSNKKSPAQTFFIKEGNRKKVLRGSLVSESCKYNIIKDIHSWYIATPKVNNTNELSIKSNIDC